MSRLTFCAVLGIVSVLAVSGQAEIQVNTYSEHNQTDPAVAISDSGFLVTWAVGPFPYDIVAQAFDASGCCVRGQFCSQDGGICDGEMVLNTDATGRCWYPDAAMAPDGTYAVVWIGENPTSFGYDVFAEVGAKP